MLISQCILYLHVGCGKEKGIERDEERKERNKKRMWLCQLVSLHLYWSFFKTMCLCVNSVIHSVPFSGGRKVSPTGIFKCEIVKPVFSNAEQKKIQYIHKHTHTHTKHPQAHIAASVQPCPLRASTSRLHLLRLIQTLAYKATHFSLLKIHRTVTLDAILKKQICFLKAKNVTLKNC